MESHAQLGDEGGSHGADQRAVVELERHFRADGLSVTAGFQDQVVTTGPQDLGSGR